MVICYIRSYISLYNSGNYEKNKWKNKFIKTKAKVIKQSLKKFCSTSEGNTCTAEPNLQVSPFAQFSKELP